MIASNMETKKTLLNSVIQRLDGDGAKFPPNPKSLGQTFFLTLGWGVTKMPRERLELSRP